MIDRERQLDGLSALRFRACAHTDILEEMSQYIRYDWLNTRQRSSRIRELEAA